jgi:hypothetical protein
MAHRYLVLADPLTQQQYTPRIAAHAVGMYLVVVYMQSGVLTQLDFQPIGEKVRRRGHRAWARRAGAPPTHDDLLRIVDRSRIAPQAVIVEGGDHGHRQPPGFEALKDEGVRRD